MNEKELLKVAKKLVNIELNAIINRYANLPESLRYYTIRYESMDDSGFALQPTHSNIFYGISKFIDIAQICQLGFYVCVAPNADGVPAPTLRVYYC